MAPVNEKERRRLLESEVLDLTNERNMLVINMGTMQMEAEQLRKNLVEDENVQAEFYELLRDLLNRPVISLREHVGVRATLRDIKITIGKNTEALRMKIYDITSAVKKHKELGKKIEETKAELAQKEKVIPWTPRF